MTNVTGNAQLGSSVAGSVPELRPYQHEAIRFAEAAGERWVYADAAGSGKTPTTLEWLGEVASSALVIAPDAVCDQWLAQAAQWGSLEPLDLRGAPAARERALRAFQSHVGVTNFDLLRRDQDKLVQLDVDALVVDEAHRLKGRSNQTALAARKLAKRARSTATLTGTPLLNGAEELWVQLHVARPKQYTSFWRWANEHFVVDLTTHHGKLQNPVPDILGLKPGHDELIRAEAADVLISRTIDELLPGLPPVNTHIFTVELGPEERQLYDSIRKKGWGRHGDSTVRTKNIVSRMTRLRQLSSEWNGILGGGNGAYTVTPERPGAKVSAAAEMLNGSSEQAVVLTAYQQSARTLAELVPGAVLYTGSENKRARAEAVSAFRSGNAPFIVGTIAALGEGVDGLQVAHRMVRLDRDWTPARNDQIVARIRRSGQLADRIDVVDVVAYDTIDQSVAEALARKEAVIDAVLG